MRIDLALQSSNKHSFWVITETVELTHLIPLSQTAERITLYQKKKLWFWLFMAGYGTEKLNLCFSDVVD